MAFGDASVGLLFRFRADSKEAQDEIKSLRKTYESETQALSKGVEASLLKAGQSYGLSGERMAQLKSVAGLTAGAVGAVGTVAVGVGAALFTMAKNASDAGSEIFDLKAKTGLGAESLSALKFAADQSGSSVQEAAQAFVIYQNKLTDAAAKGKDLFGIDARKALADQEYALRALVGVLNGPLPAGYSRSSLAAELMGRSGSNLIATFDTMGGSFDRFLEQARRMGVVLSEEDVRAADEFGDSLTVLETQLSAVGNKMALQFAPEITRAMKTAGEEVSRNKDLIVESGHIIGEAIAGQIDQFRQLAFSVRTVRSLLAGLPFDMAAAAAAANELPAGSGGAGDGAGQGAKTGVVDAGNAVRVNPDTMRPFRTPEEMERERQKAAREAEREAKKSQGEAERESERQVGVVRRLADEYANLASQVEHFNDSAVEQRIVTLRLNSGVETLTGSRRKEAEALLALQATELRTLDVKEKIGAAQEKAKQDEQELRDLRLNVSEQVRAELDKQLEAIVGQETELEKVNRLIRGAEVLGVIDAQTAAWLRAAAAVNDYAQQVERTGLPAPVGNTGQIPQAPGQEKGPWVDPKAFEGEFGKPPDMTKHMDVIGTFKDFASGAFKSVTAGFGQMVQGFMAGEKLSGRAFLAMAKSAILGMAVQSGVAALFEAAKGFAALFFNPAEAASHFTASGIFAVVAGMGGIAGALIPGGGGSTAAAGSTFAASGSGSGTSERDRTIRDRRYGGSSDPNQTLDVRVHVIATPNSAATLEHVKTDYERGGTLRSLFRGDMLGEATG